MGFSGLSHWNESDGAADFRHVIKTSLNKTFKKELKNDANEHNTPGWLNALLLFKEYPSIVKLLDNDILKFIDDRIERDMGAYLNDGSGYDLIRNFRSIQFNKSLFEED